jgi:hypothetical protein
VYYLIDAETVKLNAEHGKTELENLVKKNRCGRFFIFFDQRVDMDCGIYGSFQNLCITLFGVFNKSYFKTFFFKNHLRTFAFCIFYEGFCTHNKGIENRN